MAITDLKVQAFQTYTGLVSFAAGGGLPAYVQTGGNVFPMELEGETLVVKISTDGGSTYPTTRTHTFIAGSGEDHTGDDPPGDDEEGFHMSIADVVASIQSDETFMSSLHVYAVGTELAIKTTVAGNRALKVDATSTGIGVDLLQFISGQIGNGSITTIISIVTDGNGQFTLFFT